MFELITTYYKASEPEREAENMQCLVNNLNHPLIDRVHLFLQSSTQPHIPKSDKLKFVQHGKRPTFSELFSYGNTLRFNINKIVANSDIYFDDSLKLANKALQKFDVLALTRWDLKENGVLDFYNNFKSQDVWIFKSIIEENIGNYHIGRHGCDNRLVYEFKKNKYKIANPSFDIRAIHVHESDLRSYFKDPNYEFVLPPYNYLLPSSVSGRITKQHKFNYYESRYRYFKSISNNSLSGVNYLMVIRLYSFCISKYYAQMLKRFA